MLDIPPTFALHRHFLTSCAFFVFEKSLQIFFCACRLRPFCQTVTHFCTGPVWLVTTREQTCEVVSGNAGTTLLRSLPCLQNLHIHVSVPWRLRFGRLYHGKSYVAITCTASTGIFCPSSCVAAWHRQLLHVDLALDLRVDPTFYLTPPHSQSFGRWFCKQVGLDPKH